MSYCRFGEDSDVYCFLNDEDKYEIWCKKVYVADSSEKAVEILQELRKQGFKVPEEAINDIRSGEV